MFICGLVCELLLWISSVFLWMIDYLFCGKKLINFRHICPGGYNDVPERARVDPGGRQPRVRALQPQAHHRAEHTAARRAAIAVRPAVAHTGQT